MITNKERIEKLLEQIRLLGLLAEEIREQDIYPVSFFSQAFDISGKIQECLQEIELFQIKLIEIQANEQHERTLSAVRQSANTLFPEDTVPVSPEPPVPPSPEPPVPVSPEPLVPPVKEERKVIPSYLFEQKNLIDLKKMITLNDRFLFCRELFANNENLMNQVLKELNTEESFDASVDYLQKRFEWDFDDKNVTDFLAILKKRFL
jgi:hypothetical protein